MKSCSFLELAEKDVINLCTGENMGRICDLEINTSNACILSVIVPEQGSGWGFGKANEVLIPWQKIECIGEDAVLVRITTEEKTCCTVPRRKPKRNLFGKQL